MIRSLRISLTERCNYSCFFCHNEGNLKKLETNKISLLRIKKLIMAAKRLNINKITITGGEPFLNRDLPAIIDIIKDTNNEAEINIASNLAIAQRPQLINIAKKVKRFNVNFQSNEKENFASITGMNSLDKVKEKIILLVNEGAHISLNFVFTKKNSHDLLDVLNFANQNSIDVKILEMVKSFSDDQQYEDILLARNTVIKFRNDLKEINLKNSSDEIFSYNNHTVRIIYSYDNHNNIKAHKEHGEMRITPEFDIRPCLNSDRYNLPLVNELDGEDIEIISKKIRTAYNLYIEQKCTLASVAIIKYQNRLIMVQRTGGKVLTLETPGGHIEENESPEEAVIREVKEESNLDVKIVRKISSFYRNNSLAHYFECEILNPQQLENNDDIQLIPIEDLYNCNITDFAKENLRDLGLL